MASVLTFGLASNILSQLTENQSDENSIRLCNGPDSIADFFSDLKRRPESFEVVILGSKVPEPVQMAQRIHAVDKTLSVVVLAPPSEIERLKQTFQFALFISDKVQCVIDVDIEAILNQTVLGIKRTVSKRKHSLIVRGINSSLASTPRENQVIEAAVHLDKLLDYAPVAIAIVSADASVLAWNQKAQTTTGYTEREVLLKPMDSLFEITSKASFHESLQKAKRNLGTITIEGTGFIGGDQRFFEFTIGRLAETESSKSMVVFHDISARKNAEVQILKARELAENASESKTRFLANMSHEIRTPIGAILGFLDLMKQPGATPSDIQDFISTIDRNGNQLLRLIDDILDISKIEAGKVSILSSRFSLIGLLADINSLMGFRAREKSLSFKIELETEIPNFIDADAIRMRQVLSNLIGNAIKFTEKGSVSLIISYIDSVLSFKVKDTGIGLTPSQSELLFAPFMQADPTITRRFGGTGLGLALSKKLASLMGGDLVLAESAQNRGSTFLFTMEAEPASHSKLVGAEAILHSETIKAPQSTGDALTLEGMKFLLVEDSPDNQFLVSRYIKASGGKVEVADNGLIGVEKALASVYDVIIMDMQMPICDGLEATRRLRGKGFDRPIVALTAHAMEEERRKAFAAGCTDYLTKPIDKIRLIEVLARYANY